MSILWAATTLTAQNFVPTAGVFYNIVQTSSNMVVCPAVSGGLSTTQPVVATLANLNSQAFEFIAVQGATDTYFIRNGEGNYLNKVTGVSWDYWSVIFQPDTVGTSSEWVISGTDPSNVRLQLVANSKYLASDNITSGSSLYCDKAVDNVNGAYKLQIATIDNKPTFMILGKSIPLEIEKDLQPCPIFVVAKGQTYNIDVTPSTGFWTEKTSYTPADFTAGSGKLKIYISATTANIGDTGKVVFSYTRSGVVYKLDSIPVTAVATYPRYFISHKASGLVIGTQSSSSYPALTSNIGDVTQYFILRPVHPAVSDSLFYIEQDGDYLMLKKSATSGWDTEYGQAADESIWKIVPQTNGTWSISNFLTGKYLGTDDTIVDSRLYDDKAFVVDATSKPFSEWILENSEVINSPTISTLSGVSLSGGLLDSSFVSTKTTYNVLAPADLTAITVTGISSSKAAFINNNGAQLTKDTPAIINCVSGDNSSTTNYTFNYVQLGFSDWAARGETNASRSIPSQWGWKCANANWVSANSTAIGTVRYIDNPAHYYSLGDTLHTGMMTDTIPYKGRVMYIRWDGNIGVKGVYRYPVVLQAGKNYILTGKFAWNSVIPSGVTADTLSFGINTAADSTGTIIATADSVVQSTDLMDMHNFKLTFNPVTSGLYYFTIQSKATILAAIGNLNLSDGITALENPKSSRLFATVSGQFVNIHGTKGGDKIKVFSVSGQMIKQVNANSDITPIVLESGVYLIEVNNSTLKVVK